MPRIEKTECSLDETRGKKQDRFAHKLKVANRSFVVSESLSRGLRLAAGGAGLKSVSLFSRSPSGDSKGCSPWRAFGDFPRVGKVTRGRRGGAPSPLRVWELCSHIGERREGSAPRIEAEAHVSRGQKIITAAKPRSKNILPLPAAPRDRCARGQSARPA